MSSNEEGTHFEAMPRWKNWIITHILRVGPWKPAGRIVDRVEIVDVSIGSYVCDSKHNVAGQVVEKFGKSFFTSVNPVFWSAANLRSIADEIEARNRVSARLGHV